MNGSLDTIEVHYARRKYVTSAYFRWQTNAYFFITQSRIVVIRDSLGVVFRITVLCAHNMGERDVMYFLFEYIYDGRE